MSVTKSAFQFQLSGYAPANRDAVVRLTNAATGVTIERKPFLDGSLLVRDLEPGPYEVAVLHPNLIAPVFQKPVRLFPMPMPTRVPVPVPPALFRDTPIAETPDADLTPVGQAAEAARRQTGGLARKAPGEVIRADDWNALAGAVADLARAVADLTRLVAPQGHDHPELEAKIDEVQGNVRRFAEAYGKSLLELRREVEAQKARKQLDRAVGELELTPADPRVGRLYERLDDLEGAVLADPLVFTDKLARFGTGVIDVVNAVADERDDPAEVLGRDSVAGLANVATFYAASGRKTRPEAELDVYKGSAARTGGQALGLVLKP